MEEMKRRICFQYVLLLLIGSFASHLFAFADTIFYESFDEDFNGRWITSEKDDIKVGISTSRIHARGPVGVEGLLTTRWLMITYVSLQRRV